MVVGPAYMLCVPCCAQQKGRFHEEHTVALHLQTALLRSGVGPRELDAAQAELLASVGLQGKQGQLCSTLSGGEERRLCVAAAFAGDPRIVLLDEVGRFCCVHICVSTRGAGSPLDCLCFISSDCAHSRGFPMQALLLLFVVIVWCGCGVFYGQPLAWTPLVGTRFGPCYNRKSRGAPSSLFPTSLTRYCCAALRCGLVLECIFLDGGFQRGLVSNYAAPLFMGSRAARDLKLEAFWRRLVLVRVTGGGAWRPSVHHGARGAAVLRQSLVFEARGSRGW